MALPNTDVIYSKVGDVQSSALILAVNASLYDAAGTIGTDVYKVWGADTTNGGFLQRIRIKYVANATTTSVACVMKFFWSTATSGATTNSNMFFLDEIVLGATGALTTTAANSPWDVMFNFSLPPGGIIYAKITVAQGASTGFIATGIGGKY